VILTLANCLLWPEMGESERTVIGADQSDPMERTERNGMRWLFFMGRGGVTIVLTESPNNQKSQRG
jgi:hypothetical protein